MPGGENKNCQPPVDPDSVSHDQVLPQPHRAQACLLALRQGPECLDAMRVGEKGELDFSHSHQALIPTLANGVRRGGHPGGRRGP